MKVLSALMAAAVFAAVPGAASAQATDPAEMAEAHAILAIMFPPAEREATFDKISKALVTQFRASMPPDAFKDPGLKAIIDESIDKSVEIQRPVLRKHLPDYFGAIEAAYSHEFTLAELKDIHAFALTPSGRHYLSRSSALVSDPAFGKAMTDMMVDAQAATQPLIKDMTEKVTTYLKAHPDVAAKIAAENKQQ